jgi:hypothetical protein
LELKEVISIILMLWQEPLYPNAIWQNKWVLLWLLALRLFRLGAQYAFAGALFALLNTCADLSRELEVGSWELEVSPLFT